ncbi:MAG: hypothetical protein P4L28_03960 [Paludibacteraceae bacterium]|nr:hypothetical protein [Paludibacteraceae bacterium]
MVFYKQTALDDLQEIFISLVNWKTTNNQQILEFASVLKYRNELKAACENLDTMSYHRKAIYKLHKQYGTYIYQYKRNSRTSWYIIYNKFGEDVYIEKIINNYKTV